MLPGADFAPVVASKTLANGIQFKIYDVAGGAMVMEAGEAYAERPYKLAKGERHSLTKLWAAIAPDEPMPDKLVALNARVDDGKEPTRPAATRVAHPSTNLSAQTEDLASCGNGCCSYEWMTETFPVCTDDYDVDWMDFDSFYGSHNVNDAWFYEGFVCSASGTSHYEWTLGTANSGDIAIDQAHYFNHWWQAGVNWNPFGSNFYNEDLWAFVNEPFHQHRNTWCGGVEHE
ncbi:MAG TPA: hypothetical protein VHP33_10795 [Polyangiaceae bacterium]|nr:hypothetical protein [Polyangiaceae bacterium]